MEKYILMNKFQMKDVSAWSYIVESLIFCIAVGLAQIYAKNWIPLIERHLHWKHWIIEIILKMNINRHLYSFLLCELCEHTQTHIGEHLLSSSYFVQKHSDWKNRSMIWKRKHVICHSKKPIKRHKTTINIFYVPPINNHVRKWII